MQQKESEEASLIFRYYPDICLEGLMKAMTTPQYNWCLGSYLNTRHHKYETALSHDHNHPTKGLLFHLCLIF
jgi:hypothetical protein